MAGVFYGQLLCKINADIVHDWILHETSFFVSNLEDLSLHFQASEPVRAVGGSLDQPTPPQTHLVEPHPFLEILVSLPHSSQAQP